MRVLAIDTALAACAAAVLDSEADAILACESIPMVRGHAEALMPLLAGVMKSANIGFDRIDRVAVTVGPGSFTGLRVGVSAARGIAIAASKPAVGLSTLAALAAPMLADDDRTPVMAAIDARNNLVYMQIFGAGAETSMQPCIAALSDAVRAACERGGRVVGSAAEMIAAAWPDGAPPPPVIDSRAAPAIEWVARLGAEAIVSKAMPKPLYLQPPGAKPRAPTRVLRR